MGNLTKLLFYVYLKPRSIICQNNNEKANIFALLTGTDESDFDGFSPEIAVSKKTKKNATNCCR